ncbi:hypothetical protein BH24ACT15_BH24ACT15_38640 [soil metagenome]
MATTARHQAATAVASEDQGRVSVSGVTTGEAMSSVFTEPLMALVDYLTSARVSNDFVVPVGGPVDSAEPLPPLARITV